MLFINVLFQGITILFYIIKKKLSYYYTSIKQKNDIVPHILVNKSFAYV